MTLEKWSSSSYLEQTLVIVKPDGVRRALVGAVLERIERAGLRIAGLKLSRIDLEFAKRHYRYEDIAQRHGEKIWMQLLDYIAEGPVVAIAVEGVGSVAVLRKLCGSTEPASAAPGTIRGDFCHHSYGLCNGAGSAVRNLIHASATVEEAREEVRLWFSDSELHAYSLNDRRDHYLD